MKNKKTENKKIDRRLAETGKNVKKRKTANDAVLLLRKSGLRATDTRISLISLLQNAKYPLSVREIINGLGRKDFDQVTVYRTVNSFKNKGVVREVDFHGDLPRYEMIDSKNNHHHIICTGCRRIEDFTICEAKKIEKKVLSRSERFSKITDHSFDFYGLCNECQKQVRVF